MKTATSLMYLPWFLSLYGIALSCNSGWSPFGGFCYKVSQHLYSHEMANRYCQLAESKLASYKGMSYLLFFDSLPNFSVREEYWLHECDFESPDDCTSSSSSVCPYVHLTALRSEYCSEKKYFICQKEENSVKCPTGFDNFRSYCYRAITQEANYEDATKFCLMQQGEMAVLDSEREEWAAISAIIGNNRTFMVGARKDNDSIKWINGEDFIPISQEFGDFKNVSCVGLQSKSEHPTEFEWAHLDCGNKSSYLCEAKPLPPPTTTQKPTTTTPQPPLLCPHGQNWKAHNISGSCYWETTYETDTLNWYQARQFCQLYGGDLASYMNRAEETVGLAGARGHYKGLWIGLKRDENNVFYWTDDSPMNYTNWAMDEPNLGSRTKYCVAHSSNLAASWALDYCGVRRWFVCKAPMVRHQVVPSLTDKKIKCEPKGVSAYRNQWYQYEGHCYLVHEVSGYVWNTANTFCQDNGGLLASIHSFNETNFILTLTTKSPDTSFWIGLSAYGLQSTWSWSDNTSLDFIYWSEYKSEEDDGLNTCVAFNEKDGSWNVEHCNRLLGVICKRGINSIYDITTTEPTTIMPGNCEKGWYNYGNKCYKSFATEWFQSVTWKSAKEACEEIDASLVSIHSQGEQDLLTEIVMEESRHLWIGLQSKESGSVYNWCDESLMDYTNWDINEPHYISDSDLYMFSGPSELCVVMSTDEMSMGKWNDIACTEKKGYVCEKYKDPMLKEPYQDPFACSNITGWYKLKQSCYGLFEGQELTWLDAQHECKQYGADLISYKNTAVAMFMEKKMKRNDSLYWIGVREVAPQKYKYVTGNPLFYAGWKAGQPVAASNLFDNCVATTPDGRWIVRSCKEKFPFMCRLAQANVDDLKVDDDNINSQQCPDLWDDFGGNQCYMIELDVRKSWSNAMHFCFKQGGHLASFHSEEEIQELIKAINIRNVRSPYSVHIGLGKKFDGSFSWVDGSPLDFTYWKFGEPSGFYVRCVSMDLMSGKWSSISCGELFHGFICSKTKKKSYSAQTLDRNSSLEENVMEHKLAAGAIFGIVICSIVIFSIIGVVIYYLRPTKQIQPKLLDPELL